MRVVARSNYHNFIKKVIVALDIIPSDG